MNNAFKYSIFKICIFSIFFLTKAFQLYCMPLNSDKENRNKSLKRQIEQLKKRYPEIENNINHMLLKLKEKEPEFNEKFKNINTDSFSEKMQKKAEKLIHPNLKLNFNIGTHTIKTGLYWGDIFKFAFTFSDYKIDKFFYNELKKYYTEYIFNKIINNYEGLISLISKFNLENEKNRSLDGISLNKRNNNKINFTKELYNQLKRDQGISLKEIIKSPFLRKLAMYFTFAEVSRISKNTFLGERDIISLKLFAKSIKDSRPVKLLFQQRMGIYDFFKTFKFLTNFTTKPLITSTSFISRGILELIKYNYQEQKKENLQKKIPAFIKYYSYFMNSYFYILVKEIFILAFIIKKLDTYMYKKCWANFIKNNCDEFLKILKQYKSIKTKYKKRTKANEANFNTIEEELKNFIINGHNLSFNFWLRYKNLYNVKIESLVDFLINSPTYFIATKKTFGISKLFF